MLEARHPLRRFVSPRRDSVRHSPARRSNHPASKAVAAIAREAELALVEPDEFEEVPGKGIHGRANGRSVGILEAVECQAGLGGPWKIGAIEEPLIKERLRTRGYR